LPYTTDKNDKQITSLVKHLIKNQLYFITWFTGCFSLTDRNIVLCQQKLVIKCFKRSMQWLLINSERLKPIIELLQMLLT